MQEPNSDQRTPEWHADRLGKFTASQVYRLMGEVKRAMTEEELKTYKEENPKGTAKQIIDPTLLSDGALTYIMEVASERITGMPAVDDLDTFAMKWGREQEPNAKLLYGQAFDVKGYDCGFIKYKEYGGASPDWLVGENMGCEFKCPLTRAKHMAYLCLINADDLKEKYKEHYWQSAKGMLATERKMWKFISYHPHYPALKQLKILNVPWNDTDIELLRIKLDAAEKMCNYIINLK